MTLSNTALLLVMKRPQKFSHALLSKRIYRLMRWDCDGTSAYQINRLDEVPDRVVNAMDEHWISL